MKRPVPHSATRLTVAICLAMMPFSLVRPAAPPPVDGNGFFQLNSGESDYYGYAPDSYNPGQPISLFVWMHGCGGQAYGDMFAIAPFATRANQSYIAISIGGRDGACWDVNSDAPKVLAAIRDVARYFNINPRKVYLGGYSSGGDLTYRVGLENAEVFAGLLAENSDPFRDSGVKPAMVQAAVWKINVAHLAHTEDAVYPIAGVRANLASLAASGFPVAKIEKPGNHYDPDAANSGTNYDLRTFLLPYLDAGWQSPRFQPKVKASKKRLTTARSRVTLKGTSKLASTVEYKLKGKGYREARGNAAKWKFTAPVTMGRNIIRVRASGPLKKSRVLRIVVRRVPSAG